jgi:hypothetical protein
MPAPNDRTPTPSCDHCGHTRGAHSFPADLCPTEGGWQQYTFTYADPSYAPHGADSVCQTCNQRYVQHGRPFATCRPDGYRGHIFLPFTPTLVRHHSLPDLQCTQPVVNGTFSTEPAPFDFHSLPHLSDLADAINRLAGEIYRTTGRKQPLKAIVLERDMMLSMGIPPDTVLNTATGPVKIQADRPIERVTAPTTQRVQPAPEIEMRMRSWANVSRIFR